MRTPSLDSVLSELHLGNEQEERIRRAVDRDITRACNVAWWDGNESDRAFPINPYEVESSD